MSEPVVVITGGSSGIGRATALAFARNGARIAIICRDAEGGEATAAGCSELGARAIVCPTDVTDTAAVERAGSRIVAEHGRIDIWVNCAAVLLFGRFEDIPPEAFARVIETNLLGYANCSRAALSRFRAQGGRGALINVGSLLGMMPEPHVAAYVASKYAIRGLTACLRQELRDTPDIRICLVMPPAIDTPIYAKAANYSGRRARSIFPVLAPVRVARTIVRLAERPKRETVIGLTGQFLRLAALLAPGLLEHAAALAGPKLQFKREPQPPGEGNLFSSAGPDTIEGGWREYWAGRLGELIGRR